MLDVHPPHEAAHTWKDFFIHIATIVVGLLIAVGLEQTVEFLHRRHERADLLAQLNAEHARNLKDATDSAENYRQLLLWNKRRLTYLRSIADGHPSAPPPPLSELSTANLPVNAVWHAIQTSGQAAVLPEEAIVLNGEPDAVLQNMHYRFQEGIRISSETVPATCGRISLVPGTSQPDYLHADRDDLRSCIGAYSALDHATVGVIDELVRLIGAEKAIQAGETDPDRINEGEVKEIEAPRWQDVFHG